MSQDPDAVDDADLDDAVAAGAPRLVNAYLRRIGVDPATVEEPDLDTLARLQRAHVTCVPFENLAIVGDPFVADDGPGVELSTAACYEKVVAAERGGYCFELNGLFHWLLDALGYDVDRVPARVTSDEGTSAPANHHGIVVDLDCRYVVDVGMGVPVMRQPTPLDGAVRTDEVGVDWRIAECDRPDEAFQSMYREPESDDWHVRYVFSEEPCDLDYFRATNDFLQTAPESPFTGDPVVQIETEVGHRKLSGTTLTEREGDAETERSVPEAEWHETVAREFGLSVERAVAPASDPARDPDAG
ncbi:arylamine N-acetyltransferase family protein [Haloparvum sp. AD34]